MRISSGSCRETWTGVSNELSKPMHAEAKTMDADTKPMHDKDRPMSTEAKPTNYRKADNQAGYGNAEVA